MQDDIRVTVNPALKHLIPAFLESRKTDLSEITTALGDSDYEAIRIKGHNMRGCGAGYGFQPITDLGASIEQAATDKDDASIQTTVDSLTEYLANIVVVYE